MREVKKTKKGKSLLWLTIICGIMAVFAIFLGVRYFLNEWALKEYREGSLSDDKMEMLLKLNFPERYLPHYNLGNIAYEKGDYDEAIVHYEEALKRKPGFYKEERNCRTRVNLALSMVKQIDLSDLSTEKKVNTVIKQLQAARTVLTEDGCANPQVGVYDGHSEDAEQLKKEIDQLIAQLQQNPQDQQQDPSDEDGDQEEQDQKEESESMREKELRKKMEEQKKESAKERAEAQRREESSGEGSGGGDEDFSGKEW